MACADFVLSLFSGSFRFLILLSIIGFIVSMSLLFRNELSKSVQILQINNHTVDFFKIEPNQATSKIEDSYHEQLEKYQNELLEKIYIDRTICIRQMGGDPESIFTRPSVECKHFCEMNECASKLAESCEDESWINYKNKCMKLVDEELTWQEAETNCRSMNSTLLTIQDINFQNFISKMALMNQLRIGNYFLGLKRKESALKLKNFAVINNFDWMWIDGSNLEFSNWNYGEPNFHNVGENCAELIINPTPGLVGRWNDIDCSRIRRKSICEKNSLKPANVDDLVFDYLKHRILSKENLVEFMLQVDYLSSRNISLMSASQLQSLANILTNIAKQENLEIKAVSNFINIINNILNAPKSFFKRYPQIASSLLRIINSFVGKVALNETVSDFSNASPMAPKKFKVSKDNLIVSLNEGLLIDDENKFNEINYLPNERSFLKKINSNEENVASIRLATKLTISENSLNTFSIKSFELFNSSNGYLPMSLNALITLSKYKFSLVYFKTNKLFQNPNLPSIDDLDDFNEYIAANQKLHQSANRFVVASPIFSLNVDFSNNSTFVKEIDYVDYEIKLNKNFLNDLIGKYSLKCGYWKFKENESEEDYWSTSGCEYLNYNPTSNIHRCRCNETKNLALLISPLSLGVEKKTGSTVKTVEATAFNKVNVEMNITNLVPRVRNSSGWAFRSMVYFGLAMSAVGYLAMIVSFIVYKDHIQGIVHKILLAKTTCLFMCNALFLGLTLVPPLAHLRACTALATLLHYFIIVAFLWMLVMAIAQYMKFIKIIDNYMRFFMAKSSLFTFCLPFIVPTVIYLSNPTVYLNEGQSICWLKGNGLYLAYVAPLSIILLITIGFFLAVILNIFNRPVQLYLINENIRSNQIGISLSCFMLMGISWVVGFVLLFDEQYKTVGEIIFCVFNSVHGLLIFMFHLDLINSERPFWSAFFSAFRVFKHRSIFHSKKLVNINASSRSLNNIGGSSSSSSDSSSAYNNPNYIFTIPNAAGSSRPAAASQPRPKMIHPVSTYRIVSAPNNTEVFFHQPRDAYESFPDPADQQTTARTKKKFSLKRFTGNCTSTDPCSATSSSRSMNATASTSGPSSSSLSSESFSSTYFLSQPRHVIIRNLSENNESSSDNDLGYNYTSVNDDSSSTNYYNTPIKVPVTATATATAAATVAVTVTHQQHDQASNTYSSIESMQSSTKSNNYFVDDVVLRINRLNDSLKRIKRTSREKSIETPNQIIYMTRGAPSGGDICQLRSDEITTLFNTDKI